MLETLFTDVLNPEMNGCGDACQGDQKTKGAVCHRTDLRRLGSGDEQRRNDDLPGWPLS